MLLFQKISITEENMGIKILESVGLAKPEKVIMNKRDYEPRDIVCL